MEIKDVKANQGKVDLVMEIVKKEEPRVFNKFGKDGRVCNAKAKDATGQITITLWNEDVDKVQVGDKIHLENGWCSEYKGERQVSSGKFGKIEVLNSKTPTSKNGRQEQPEGILTNDPQVLAKERGQAYPDEDSDDEDPDEDAADLEEYVE